MDLLALVGGVAIGFAIGLMVLVVLAVLVFLVRDLRRALR